MDSTLEARWQSADRIDAVCDEFERACRSGSAPAIEEYLPRVPEIERSDLVVELVVLDVNYRRGAGQALSVDEYAARFPEHATQLRSRVPSLLESAHQSLDSTVVRWSGAAADTSPEIPTVLSAGCRLGRYEFQQRLGQGSFGEVWRAWDPVLKRPVAIKTLRSDRRFPVELRESFLAEGSKLAQFRHPAIVGVFDVAVEGGRAYIVSEFIDGETLAARLDRPPGTVHAAEAAELIATLAEALHHAHLQGIVHRDIKPTNILIDRERRPFLLDFGLAITETEQLREPAGVVGTLAYMSPEQVGERSHHADARADIYGLGVVLYRLMTGRLPFVADSREQWVDQILHRAPRPPRTIDDGIPQELERVCLKCLSKNVEERYSTAADLARELRGAVMVRPSAARPRWRWVAAAGVGGAILLWGLAPILRKPEPPPGDLITPLPLLWPVHDEISSFWPDNNGRRLHVHCEQYGLVQLGELTSADGDAEILVHIGQVNWDAADIGLFWGFRRADDNDDSQQFESLEVDVQYDGQFVLDRSLTTFERLHDEDRGRIGLAGAAIDPPAGGEHRLLIRFTAGRLSHVEWDGVPRPELLNSQFPGEMSDQGNIGKFGVLVNGTGGSFSRLKWNDRELRFAGRPAP